jgi:hypothetical protein
MSQKTWKQITNHSVGTDRVADGEWRVADVREYVVVCSNGKYKRIDVANVDPDSYEQLARLAITELNRHHQEEEEQEQEEESTP